MSWSGARVALAEADLAASAHITAACSHRGLRRLVVGAVGGSAQGAAGHALRPADLSSPPRTTGSRRWPRVLAYDEIDHDGGESCAQVSIRPALHNDGQEGGVGGDDVQLLRARPPSLQERRRPLVAAWPWTWLPAAHRHRHCSPRGAPAAGRRDAALLADPDYVAVTSATPTGTRRCAGPISKLPTAVSICSSTTRTVSPQRRHREVPHRLRDELLRCRGRDRAGAFMSFRSSDRPAS